MNKLMRLKDLVPNYYANIYDMDVLLQIEQPLLDKLQALIDQSRDNHYALVADEQGISIFERMLGIGDIVGQDIDTRRYNVIMALLPPKPITMAYMKELLSTLNIDAKLVVDSTNFHVEVETHTTDTTAMKRLTILLKRLLPSNMTFTTFNLQSTSTNGTVSNGTDTLYSATISNKGGMA